MNRINKKSILSLLIVLLASCVIFAGCGDSSKKPIEAKDGYAEGRIGDSFKTYFFVYSIDSVSFVKEYAGVKAQEGNHFIDAVITIKNTFENEIPLWLSDFQIQWDINENDENFDYALSIDSENTLSDGYKLQKAETITKHYIFEVPENSKKYSISFLEIFDDGTETGKDGDVFFTYFENNK